MHDIYSGNILINRNEEIKGKPLRMNMIDCGLVIEMGEKDHVNLVKVLGAFIKKDGYLAGQLMIDAAKKCHANELDVELFCAGLARIIEEDEERVRFFKSSLLCNYCYHIVSVQLTLPHQLFFNAELFGERW